MRPRRPLPRRLGTLLVVARRAGLLAAGCALGGAGLVAWASAAVEHEAGSFLHRRPEDVPPRRVAIVPGARVEPDGRPSATLEDRLEGARRLFELGRVERILVSGDHRSRAYDEPDAMRAWLLAHGVPAEAVFTDHAGLRTLDTMERAARVFQVEDAVVCTNEFHLARSVFLARRAGIDAEGLVVDRRRYAKHRRNAVREALARTLALLDVTVLGTGPRHLGPPIPIDGPAEASWDRASLR